MNSERNLDNNSPALSRYLFIFGFQPPDIWGTEFEDSQMVWIDAPNEDMALAWGKEVAESYCSKKFPKLPSWKSSNFAHWIVHDDYESFRAAREKHTAFCRVGELPVFD